MSKIHHLYWRAGFGLSPAEWQEKRSWPVRKAVDDLFLAAGKKTNLEGPTTTIPNNELTDDQRQALRKEERKKVRKLTVDWIMRMGDTKSSPLLERMSLFWHGHFACQIRLGQLATAQLNTIRTHALGNFREMVQAIARDVAMIRYLNNQQNKKNQPNENFARELMELFTIGRGNYSEQDIKEAARAFTGWSSNLGGDFVFRRFQHDNDKKTFFGKTGKFDGDDIIDIILEKRQTAHFIATKVYRYFVNPTPDPQHVELLADVFYDSGYDISKLMRTVFESDWFYDQKNVGVKIKSPIELMGGMIRSLDVQFKDERALLFTQRALGQALFDPPNVAGWPGGRSWIDNSTLMLRLNLATYLFNNSDVNLRTKDDLKADGQGKAFRRLTATVDLEPILKMTSSKNEEASFDELCAYFFPKPPAVSLANFKALLKAKQREQFVAELSLRMLSMPEYQTC